MPILEVEIVVHQGETLGLGIAAELADRAAEVFGSPAGTTWVRVKPISHENYAESGGGPPEGVRPVFVSVLKATLPPHGDATAAEVARLTDAIAKVCARPPENIHIVYLPEGAGRVALGGQLMRR